MQRLPCYERGCPQYPHSPISPWHYNGGQCSHREYANDGADGAGAGDAGAGAGASDGTQCTRHVDADADDGDDAGAGDGDGG